MSISSSSEFFINMKDVPKYNPRKHYFEQTKDVLDFYEEEKYKLLYGTNIGGFHVHPWLYWHVNYFKTPLPIIENGREREKILNPFLDDNILYLTDTYKQAEEENKGMFVFGARGVSKSTIIASLTGWLASTRENGTTSIIGGSDGDLNAISSLLQTGMDKIHPAFYIPRLKSDWKSLVELGVKEKDNTKHIYSRLDIRNADDKKVGAGEKGAGLSPVGFVMDEALHEDTVIPTTEGKVLMKDIKIGDTVYGADGKPTKILTKIDPGVVPTYKFTFADGRTITASDNHKWKVWHTSKQRFILLTTKDIREKYYYEKYDSRYNKTNKSFIYSIPLNKAIEYTTKKLPVDPYWLGCHAGDGNSVDTTINTPDKEILNYCIKYAKDLGLTCTVDSTILPSGIDFYKCRIKKVKGRLNPLKEVLKSLGYINNKHIPKEYFNASIKQRLQFIKGLMNTDGHVTPEGHIEFSTSILKLAEGLREMLHGLGISFRERIRVPKFKYKGETREGKPSHRFQLHTDIQIFTLPRHLSKIYDTNKSLNNNSKKRVAYRTRSTIVNIEPVGDAQVYCIGVDNKDKLFLAGDYIVSHNCGKFSFIGLLEAALPSFQTEHGAKLIHFLSGTGGNSVLSRDAKKAMQNPGEYNLLMLNRDRLDRGVPEEALTWKDDKEEHFCTFVPAQMSYRLAVPKLEKRFSDVLGIKNNDLNKIKIRITDWTKATETLDEILASKKTDSSVNKHKMYYPTKVDHCFLIDAVNPFPTAIISKRIEELETTGRIGKDVRIYKEGTGYKYELINKKRAEVSHGGGIIDAPIIMYQEIPEKLPPKHMFVGGHDGYKIDVSDTDSLGSTYIIKRRNLEPNSPCETIAASISTRPEKMRMFLQDSESMMKAWNAMTNMESIDVGLQHHLENKGLQYELLCPAFSFTQKTSRHTTKLNSKFGLYPNTGNNTYRFSVLVDHCWEEFTMGLDEDNNPIIKYGVEFIDDIDLLKEMLYFKPGNNVDRITSFSHALVYAKELDKDKIQPARAKKKGLSQKELNKKRALTGNHRYGTGGHHRY